MSCWTLLQAPGEAVLVPAGAPHQVLPWRVQAGALWRAQNIGSIPQRVLSPSENTLIRLSSPLELGRAGSHASAAGKRSLVVLKSSGQLGFGCPLCLCRLWQPLGLVWATPCGGG